MNKPKLGAERARELFSYDPETGELRWRVARGSRTFPGDLAGTIRPDGYVQVRVDGVFHLGHRLVWLILTGNWPVQFIDHINGSRRDNRRTNLRDVSRKCNQENHRRARAGSSTGVMGVNPSRGRFKARITVGGVESFLGRYATPEEAHQAYLTAKRQLHAGCTI